jgi:hypothetical protein
VSGYENPATLDCCSQRRQFAVGFAGFNEAAIN